MSLTKYVIENNKHSTVPLRFTLCSLDKYWHFSYHTDSQTIVYFRKIPDLNMKYKSKQAAIKNLRKFFKNSPGRDSIKLEDAYVAYDRRSFDPILNKNWVTNIMTHLKYHDLIVPVYSYPKGKRVLTGIQLTLKGKRVLGRIRSRDELASKTMSIRAGSHNHNYRSLQPTNVSRYSRSYSLQDVLGVVARLRRENPEFEIVFDVKLKGPGMDNTHTPGVQ